LQRHRASATRACARYYRIAAHRGATTERLLSVRWCSGFVALRSRRSRNSGERALVRLVGIVLCGFMLALVVAPSAFALRFTDDSYNIPAGVAGQPYSKQFNGAGGCGPALPYQYRVLSGSLPPGLSLSSTGLIAGTATSAGSWSFWVELSDQNPPSASWCRPSSAQRQFTITILPRAAFLNEPFSFQLSSAGGAAKTWSLRAGTLPPGITLSSTGLLSGTPTVPGDFTFNVQAADGSGSAVQTYSLTIVRRLKITPLAAAPTAEVARPLRLHPSASGGKPGYRWSVAGGTTLPPALSLDPDTGAISGQPQRAGSFPLKLAVTDALGLTSTLHLKLAVAAKLAITTKAVTAQAGHPIRARFRVSGGVFPLNWTILHGSLPAGIHLNRQTGGLAGTTPRAGTSKILAQVRDKLDATSQATLLLRVLP
jgi:large repetitive protein